jgi:hypothetical protein
VITTTARRTGGSSPTRHIDRIGIGGRGRNKRTLRQMRRSIDTGMIPQTSQTSTAKIFLRDTNAGTALCCRS